MVLWTMFFMVFVIINYNNNTFEPGSQSPVSAMSAIRNTNSNTNIPYLHCKLAVLILIILSVEVEIPVRRVLPVLRLAILVVLGVVPWWSHLRIKPVFENSQLGGGEGAPL